MSVLTLRCSDGSIECGGRFKYLPDEIPTNYQALVKALHDAIEKEAAENDNKYVTNEKIKPVPEGKVYDFDTMKAEFQDLVGELMTANQSNAGKITMIVEKYLGKGRKVGDCTPEQSEQLELIIIDMKDLLQSV